ncbi:dTDP-4-dehydrorhamnose reductase [Gemmata sp.]|uniref:dTDP-4-dehydrorhamnose reductase n=1 Tax=Gemmata sp. TaxID=1914242 RepID=UPI003F71225B
MRIAVLGAAGQLGRDLCPRLAGEVVPLTRADLDLGNPAGVPAALAAARPDVLVNCAAYNFVDKAETEPDAAFAVNAWGVRALAQACAAAKVRLVHFSTDYVFGLDAARSTPFAEGDAPGPVSTYGLSKLAGEYAARTFAPDALVVRTCGLYGVHGTGGKGGNFVETMLRVAGQGKPLRVVADQHCTPSYTVDVAEATAALVAGGASGLFHVTSAGTCTWHELAAETFRLAGVTADLTPITSSQFGAPALRPPYSVLSNAKLAAAGVAPPRDWRAALAAYLAARATAK